MNKFIKQNRPFTDIDGKEAGVDLVLIHLFLLSYLNHVLCKLVFFKHNFHKNAVKLSLTGTQSKARVSKCTL